MKRRIYQAIADPMHRMMLTLLAAQRLILLRGNLAAAGWRYQNTYGYRRNVAQLIRNTRP